MQETEISGEIAHKKSAYEGVAFKEKEFKTS
jgi:hypothetical protein